MEPERDIEKQLRAYAKKRRDAAGASPQMPPATRRLLQSEIARRSPPERASGSFSWFFGLVRPGFAFAICFLAVAMVGIALFLPALSRAKFKSKSLAQNNLKMAAPANEELRKDQPAEVEPTRERDRTVATPAAAPPAPAVAGADGINAPASELANADRAYKQAPAEAVNPPAGAREKEPADQLAKIDTAARERLSAGGAAGPASQASRSESAPPSLTRKTESTELAVSRSSDRSFTDAAHEAVPEVATTDLSMKLSATETKTGDTLSTNFASIPQEAAGFGAKAGLKAEAENQPGVAKGLLSNSQRFVQVLPAADDRETKKAMSQGAPAVANVLNSFNLEQNGQDIRIVDSDGSVYRGTVQLTVATGEPLAISNQVAGGSNVVTVQTALQVPAQNYLVTASGMNRSLNQNVTFSGNLQSAGVVTQNQTGAGNVAGQFQAMDKSQLSQLPLANSRISGTAVINNAQQVQINAVSAPAAAP